MDDVNKRAKKGIRLLLVRQGFLQVFTFAGGIVLARVLDPADFGIFGVTTFVVNALAILGDFGLSPALIQRKEEVTERDLQVGFTMKQVLITAVVLALWFGAPWMATLYGTQFDTDLLMWLIRALAFNLYLNTWRSISVLQLERRLDYNKLAFIEVFESISYQLVAVVMAVLGFGVWSLISAVLVRGTLGTLMIYFVAPWRIRFAFDLELAKSILRFGVPFQFHRAVGQIRTWVTPTLVATLIGADAVGFLMWASSNGRKPLAIIRNIVRVSLPHFSRLQDHREEVERILKQYVALFLIGCGMWLAVLVVAGYDLVEAIYTAKWLPAVPALLLYAVLLNLNALSWITKTALSGLGNVGFVARVTLWTTLLSIGGGVVLVLEVGFIGVPLAEVISMALLYPWLLRGLGKGMVRRVLKPSLWLVVPLAGSILVGLLVNQLELPLLLRGLLAAGVTSLVFAGISWALGPAWIRKLVRQKSSDLMGRLRGAS